MSELTDYVQGTVSYAFRDQEEIIETNSDWIDKIPSDWSIMKIERCLESLDSGSRENYDGNNGVFSIGGEHITEKGDLDTDNENFVAEEFYRSMNGGQLRTEDVLLVKDGATIGKSAIVDEIPHGKAAVNSHVYILRGKKFCSNRFLYYLIDSEIVQEQIQVSITGSAQEGLSRKFTKFVDVPVPSQKEQKSIVEFLDRETQSIGNLIEKKTELIDLLREREEALINKVTTRGLGSEVPTKEVQDEIVGELPENWEESNLGNITIKLTNGYVGPTRNILTDEGVPYIQSTHINNGEIEFDGEFFVSEEWSNDHRISKLNQGDVLLVQTGDVGESAVVREELDGANCHALIIARPVEDVNSLYLNLFLESRLGKNLLKRTQTGATLKHLNTTRIKDVTIPVPPKDEQEEIVEFLESERERFDSMIAQIEEGIERLREYRTALITNAVTGNIDVRGEV